MELKKVSLNYLLKEYKTVVSDDRTQEIAFSNDKTITIPEIIITQ